MASQQPIGNNQAVESKYEPAALNNVYIPSAAYVKETIIINKNINYVWDCIKSANFDFLSTVKSTQISPNKSSKDVVGNTRILNYNDGTSQTIQITEISCLSHSMAYSVISSTPSVSYSAANHKIKLMEVTTSNQTFIDWSTNFSNDASLEVIRDSRFKKKEAFRDLKKYLSRPICMPALTAPFVNVTPILTGSIKMPESITLENGCKDLINELTCLCFLIQHDDNDKKGLLFDAGLSKELGKPNYGKLADHASFLDLFNIKMDKNFNSLADFMTARLNYDANNIDNIILSHFHWDHCGDINDFKNAKLIMGNGVNNIRHNVCMCGGKSPGFFGFELPVNKDIIEVDWDNNLEIGPFNKCKDFYNDGSVYIVDAPGHVTGHIMLLVKSKIVWLLLAGDGIHSTKSYTGDKPIGKGSYNGQPLEQDPIRSFETITKIHAFHHMNDTKVCPAHLTLDEFSKF